MADIARRDPCGYQHHPQLDRREGRSPRGLSGHAKGSKWRAVYSCQRAAPLPTGECTAGRRAVPGAEAENAQAGAQSRLVYSGKPDGATEQADQEGAPTAEAIPGYVLRPEAGLQY